MIFLFLYIMKKIFIFSIFLFPLLAFAQKWDQKWVIGDDTSATQAGGGTLIDFASNPPEVSFIAKKPMISKANVSMSDTSGKLMFFTNGCNIYNAKYQIIKNGKSPCSDYMYERRCWDSLRDDTAEAQGYLALPHPDSNSIYYLFAVSGKYVPPPLYTYLSDAINMIKIDMSKNAGKGEVVIKKTPILKDTLNLGYLNACKHSDGKQWWFVQPRMFANCFWTTLFDGKGNIAKQYKQCVGDVLNHAWAGGGSTFSPDGTKYAMITAAQTKEVHVYDFDRCTGKLSNYKHLQLPLEDSIKFKYCAISTNSRFLYVTAIEHIYQFDLQAEDVSASRVTVATYDGFVAWSPPIFLMIQNGPDGKIYVATGSSTSYYHYINHPDSAGLKCDVRQHSIKLASPNFWSIPHFPHYRMPASPHPCITAAEDLNNPDVSWRVRIYPNPTDTEIHIADINSDDSMWQTAIYNLQGQRIKVFDWQNDQRQDISDLPPGIYVFISKNSSGKFASEKVVVQ
jgi:hypothetical protein